MILRQLITANVTVLETEKIPLLDHLNQSALKISDRKPPISKLLLCVLITNYVSVALASLLPRGDAKDERASLRITNYL